MAPDTDRDGDALASRARGLFGPLQAARNARRAARLKSLLRHPLDGAKRKTYRALLIEDFEIAEFLKELQPPAIDGDPRGPSDLSVSVIVPNYNHAAFLRERLRSIAAQRAPIKDVIILDDASQDGSRDLIAEIAPGMPFPVRTIFNAANSGSVFEQWSRGINAATGDLVWICESDDSCDDAFLETLLPYFNDRSVSLAFGRITCIDEAGADLPEINRHMDWSSRLSREPVIADSSSWFRGPFGIRCVIRNVGGCVFRRPRLEEELVADMKSYRVCGDWLFYSRVAKGGKIAFDPGAKAYFRVHGGNTSVAAFGEEHFYREHLRIARELKKSHGVSPRALAFMLDGMKHQCRRFLGSEVAEDIFERRVVRSLLLGP